MAEDKLLLPSQQRRNAEQGKRNGKQFNRSTEVGKEYELPRNLVNSLMAIDLLTITGESMEDKAILNFIGKVRRVRKFARFIMGLFSRAELEEIIRTKGMDDLDVIIYKILRDNKGISTPSVLSTLEHLRGICPSRFVIDKITLLRKKVQNERHYEKTKEVYGSSKEYEKTLQWIAQNRKSG